MQKIHVKPNNNWMNDPNGFIYYQGAYHLFYQCFPYNARWGRMHWNHVILSLIHIYSNVYYTNPDYLRCSYLEGKMLA